MLEVLRQHYVALIRDLRDQEYICYYLEAHNVLSAGNTEEILCEPSTNGKKNWKLLGFVSRRRALDHFLDALEHTNQQDLLDCLAPDRIKQEKPEQGRCAVCLDLGVRVVFTPCGHMCTCRECSTKLTKCPLRRRSIDQCVTVYF